MHPNYSKHKLKKASYQNYVSDRFNRDNHALDDMLKMEENSWLSFKCIKNKKWILLDNQTISSFRKPTFSPLALLIARRGLSTLSTLNIFTTEIVPELREYSKTHHLVYDQTPGKLNYRPIRFQLWNSNSTIQSIAFQNACIHKSQSQSISRKVNHVIGTYLFYF